MSEQQPLLNEKYPPAQGAPPLYSAPYNNPSAPPLQEIPPDYQPPPAASYQNPPPPAVTNTATIVVATPGSVSMVRYGESPVVTTCPNCHQQNMTVLSYTPGVLTFVLCGVLLLFGFLLCFWIPFLVDGCKDVKHECPNCHFPLGTYKRL